MPVSTIRARRALGDLGPVPIAREARSLASYLEDASHVEGGHAAGVAFPRSEADVAALLLKAPTVLPIGAQSSLTGGAMPMGEVMLSMARFNHILEIRADSVRVEPGVTLTELDDALRQAGGLYPPAPTFMGASIGGTVATGAAGAATFKYGTTREWVQALTVVLATGDVLDIERGMTVADRDGYFEVFLSDRRVRLPVPRYRRPAVAKVSAGYFSGRDVDLIDLFIGSEGTLGIITEVKLRILPTRPLMCRALVPFPDRARALDFTRRLRDTARDTWRTHDRRGVDVSAIEYMDRRSLSLLSEDGADRKYGVVLPKETSAVLLVTLELAETTSAQAYDEIAKAQDPDAPDTPLIRFCRLLDEARVLDDVEIALPGHRARAQQLLDLREAVPEAVNLRVARAKQAIDPRIEKTAADMIVPPDRIDELLTLYDATFSRSGLDVAVWGHLSDGNVHPNVIPRSMADVAAGRAAVLELGREVLKLGGSPLAEHGVGRNPVKQLLMQEMYGPGGIEQMRETKRALDPDWKLAPGVLFHKT